MQILLDQYFNPITTMETELTPDEHLEGTRDRIIDLNVLNVPPEQEIQLFTLEEIEKNFKFNVDR